MINFIKVINRTSISHMVHYNYIPYDSWYFISIYGGTKGEFLTGGVIDRIKEMGCKKFLSLCFYDASDNEDLSDDDKKMLFSKKQARQIIDFVDKIKDDSDSVILLHCDAGISRSGAVGSFICDYLGLNYKKFLKVNPQVLPNQYVLRLLKEESKIGIREDNSMFNLPT